MTGPSLGEPGRSKSRLNSSAVLENMQKATPLSRRKGLYADCLRTYENALRPALQARSFDRVLLRTVSRRGVDLMSLSVSDGRLRYSDLLTFAYSEDGTWEKLLSMSRNTITPSAVARIARVVALQELETSDRGDALALLHWLYKQCGPSAFDRDERRLFQNLAFVMGEFELSKELLKVFEFSRTDTLTMRADLANPNGPSPYSSYSAWQAEFSLLFERHKIEPPIVNMEISATREPFDGLLCKVHEAISDGPLVSVIVTCWQPNEELESSLRSILSQTWKNLEILLIDDASPSSYDALLGRMQAMDPRIRLLRQTENGGTYIARNAALRNARGEFVTGQDSDDWSHPRRIEKQVARMLQKPALMSTTSHALRCDPSMLFTAPGMLARRENASSLMYRRIPAIEQAGYYDATRKGGDTEYELRLRRVFGENSHYVLQPDLALIRRSRQSLSHAEFRPGWRHPSRSAYRRAYEYWHQSARSVEALKIDDQLDGARAFPIPSRFDITRQVEIHRIDIVFVDDFRPEFGARHLRAVWDEIRAVRRAGLRVGIVHMRSFRDVSFDAIDNYWSPIAQAIHEGDVKEVLLTDAIEVGVMIVRRPEIALFFSPIGVVLRPDRIVMVAEESVRLTKDKVWYEPRACQRNLKDAFSAPISWAAADKSIRQELHEILGESYNGVDLYPLVVDPSNWRYPSRWQEHQRPVVGYVGNRDSDFFIKDIAILRDIFTEESGITLRILSDDNDILQVIRCSQLPSNWNCTEQSSDLDLFLGGCAFLFQPGRESVSRGELRTILQGLASGCVVVTTNDYGKIIDPALNAEAKHIVPLVHDLWRDQTLYRTQVDNGFQFLRTKYDREQQSEKLVRIFHINVEKSGTYKNRKYNKYADKSDRSTSDTPRTNMPELGTSRVIEQYVDYYQSGQYTQQIDRMVLRSGSIESRDVLAFLASHGGLNWSQIRAMLSDYRIGRRLVETRYIFKSFDTKFLRRLGRVVALQAIQSDDSVSALTLFKVLIEAKGVVALDAQHSQLALEVAIHLKDWDFLERYIYQLPIDELALQFLEIDKHNPFINSPFSDGEKWLQLLNSYYLKAGIYTIELEVESADEARPFDRVSAASLTTIDTGDLVTVVMSSWRPDQSLVHAMRSITRQTWRNLEILLIDDASPEQFVPLIESVAASDPRIRLIRQPSNKGTYVARNRGMAEARGRYFTVHDSDDWAHPQRIERQIQALQGDTAIVSTGSFAFRCNEQLVFNLPGIPPDRENISSLTFELEPVKQSIGYFDESRKGADTEFQLRMRAVFGDSSHRILREPLAMIRLRTDSLSRSDFKRGWRHPARAMYRRNYEAWHRRIRSKLAEPYLPQSSQERKFGLPDRFQIQSNLHEQGRTKYDVVFVADFRAAALLDRSLIGEIAFARKVGLKTAILHIDSFSRVSPLEVEEFDADIEKMLLDNLIGEVVYTDEFIIDLLVIRDPSVLQFPQFRQSSLSISNILIVTSACGESSDSIFDIGDCSNHAHRMFGVYPKWCARAGGDVLGLKSAVSARYLHSSTWPAQVFACLNTEDLESERSGNSIARAILKDSASSIVSWWSDLNKLPSEVELRLHGSFNKLSRQSQPRIISDPEWISRSEFFTCCGFYTDHPGIGKRDEAQRSWITEAMMYGCIPILSPMWETVFSDAARYCAAESVGEIICSFLNSPVELEIARTKAKTWVNNISGHSDLKRIWSSFQLGPTASV